MADLSIVKNPVLHRILEESDKFNALPEDEKQVSLKQMISLSDDQQDELCRFMVSEEEDTLPKKLLLSFFKFVGNATEALTNVAAKDKAILNSMQESRQEAQI